MPLTLAFLHDLSFSTSLPINLLISYALFCILRWLSKLVYSPSPFRDIPGPPSQSWFKGNLGQLFNSKGLPFHLSLAERFGGIVKVYGFFGDEQLYISDPRALQSVVIKDQDAFEETAVFIETNKVIFGPGLVATTGEQHKRQRKITSPIFSSANLKALAPTFYTIAEKLADVLSRESAEQNEKSGRTVLDMSEWMCRIALETVGQGVLGHTFDPLDSPQNNPYTSAIKELIPTIFSLSLLRQFAPILSRLGSPAFRRKLVEWTPHKAVQKVKEISDVMHLTAQDILQEKRDNLLHEAETGSHSQRDIISKLLRANETAPAKEKLSDTELTGQMTVLIFGAQDTTAATLSRVLFELSHHPEIQEQLQKELAASLRERRSRGDLSGRLDYDVVSSLPLLDAVIKESLRLYPPVPFVRRTAIKERAIPYSATPDSDVLSSVTIPQGTTIFVGIAAANRLESVWGPDAKQWKPERWLAGDSSVSSARLPGIYSGMLSFFGGGRACIGYKFALIEMKIILAVLLSRFKFSPADHEIVWNLSQIISPAVQTTGADGIVKEEKGLPLVVEPIEA